MTSVDILEPVTYRVNYRENGEIRSVYQYIDRAKEVKKGNVVYVPKWSICLASLFFLAILSCLIAAIGILYVKPRAALYRESCKIVSCASGLSLKCINNVCDCDVGFFYTNKCIQKKTYLEKCHLSSYCKNDKNLTCIDGACKCNETQFWNGKSCVNKKLFDQACKADGECIENSFSYCDTKTGKCACDSTRFYENSSAVCYPKKSLDEKCLNSLQCQEWKSLVCVSAKCKCNSTQFWESSASKCLNLRYENQTCSATYQCFADMTCSGLMCKCGAFEYHDPITLTCTPQSTYGEACSIDYNCRSDKYLQCVSGSCQCISSYPLWSYGFDACIVPVTYNGFCHDGSDCNLSQLLICNDGTTNCSCPTNVATNYCDCVREDNNEYYWDNSNCVPAISYNQTCSSTYMCQTTTQRTICSGSKCVCPSTQYFKYSTSQCENKVTYGVSCAQPDACKSTLGLICISVCVCDTSRQLWDGTSCVDYYTYNNQICTAGQCDTTLGLVCRTDALTCACPATVSNKCDCATRVDGNEYYWNGTRCVYAKEYGQPCSGLYMCQYLTELTVCTSGNCSCPTNYVWDGEICKTCAAGWNAYRGSCFRASSVVWSSAASFTNIPTGCHGQTTARLAILYNGDAIVMQGFGMTDEYFDPVQVLGANYVSSYWKNAPPDACYHVDNGEFDAHQCHNHHGWICEYVLV